MKTINEYSKKDFLSLPILSGKIIDCDSLIFVPINEKHDSGYSYFSIIVCRDYFPIGKIDKFDLFNLIDLKEHDIRIDCLYKSKCIRVFVKNKTFLVNADANEVTQNN